MSAYHTLSPSNCTGSGVQKRYTFTHAGGLLHLFVVVEIVLFWEQQQLKKMSKNDFGIVLSTR